jgi:hypothetical protein
MSAKLNDFASSVAPGNALLKARSAAPQAQRSSNVAAGNTLLEPFGALSQVQVENENEPWYNTLKCANRNEKTKDG